MDKIIKEYLLQNKKLTITNFGVFEVVYKPSEIHPILHTFTAPGKYVIFKENVTVSSDELLDFIILREDLTKEDAAIRIDQWIEQIKATTASKEEFILSSLGSFTLNAMGKIEFASLLDADISPESFGLENFTAEVPTAKKETKQEILVEKEIFQQGTPVTEPEEKETDNSTKDEPVMDENKPAKKKKRRPVLVTFIVLLALIFSGALAIGVTYYFYPQTLQNHCEQIGRASCRERV